MKLVGNPYLVLFEDALEHLTRLHRTLRMHCGHVLIAGANGTGKQSLAKLASYTAGCQVFEIIIDTGFDITSFRKDLKMLFYQLSVENKKLAFVFTTDQVCRTICILSFN